MRKRFLLISTIIVLSAFTFAACGKKSPSSPESTNSETTTATKKDEQAKPKSATGTYNGFADTSSVEIEMSDGSYQTFMVNDEDLVNKLNDMDEGTKITFTYGAVEGQANMEILSIE